jgi:hypothetical protein
MTLSEFLARDNALTLDGWDAGKSRCGHVAADLSRPKKSKGA